MIYENIQRQFQGYLNTEQLWEGTLESLDQYELNVPKSNVFKEVLTKKYRLGHLVECFVRQQLQEDDSIRDFQYNIQYFEGKHTIGEMDFLFHKSDWSYQIETVYKFYLYDVEVGETAIEHWIGPNRKDALTLKLDKIKNVQFPIVKNEGVRNTMSANDFDAWALAQEVIFKGQLFVPFGEVIDVSPLNHKCVVGFYLKRAQLDGFKTAQFYVPSKHDWLVKPHPEVNWLTFEEGSAAIEEYLIEERSPMIWIKQDGRIDKVFVVWW